jgi:hypothetical protein
VATDLTRIGERARKEPGLVFTSLYHHICDVDNPAFGGTTTHWTPIRRPEWMA